MLANLLVDVDCGESGSHVDLSEEMMEEVDLVETALFLRDLVERCEEGLSYWCSWAIGCVKPVSVDDEADGTGL
jgi:hypothetical protein